MRGAWENTLDFPLGVSVGVEAERERGSICQQQVDRGGVSELTGTQQRGVSSLQSSPPPHPNARILLEHKQVAL